MTTILDALHCTSSEYAPPTLAAHTPTVYVCWLAMLPDTVHGCGPPYVVTMASVAGAYTPDTHAPAVYRYPPNEATLVQGCTVPVTLVLEPEHDADSGYVVLINAVDETHEIAVDDDGPVCMQPIEVKTALFAVSVHALSRK